jgi:hypothetical protein
VKRKISCRIGNHIDWLRQSIQAHDKIFNLSPPDKIHQLDDIAVFDFYSRPLRTLDDLAVPFRDDGTGIFAEFFNDMMQMDHIIQFFGLTVQNDFHVLPHGILSKVILRDLGKKCK